jgi:hypothetical protein
VQSTKLSYESAIQTTRANYMGGMVTWKEILSNPTYFPDTNKSFNTYFYLIRPATGTQEFLINRPAIVISMELWSPTVPSISERIEYLDMNGTYQKILSCSTVQLS